MINILISVNDLYLEKAKTMIYSLVLSTDKKICIYLFNRNIQKRNIEKFKKFIDKKCKAEMVEIKLSNTIFDQLPLKMDRLSIEMYYRIFAQYLLPDAIDRILWLDADIIIMNNIEKFYYQNFNDKYMVVCRDVNSHSKEIADLKDKVGIKSEHTYFNSGVLLLNLKKLRNDIKEFEILKVCELIKDKIEYPDQDILNYLYQNEVIYEEWKRYNYQLTNITKIPNEDYIDIKILHYSGGKKPWNYKFIDDTSKYYWRIQYHMGNWLSMIQVYGKHYMYVIYKLLKKRLRRKENLA